MSDEMTMAAHAKMLHAEAQLDSLRSAIAKEIERLRNDLAHLPLDDADDALDYYAGDEDAKREVILRLQAILLDQPRFRGGRTQ
jgi:hypothetical protein